MLFYIYRVFFYCVLYLNNIFDINKYNYNFHKNTKHIYNGNFVRSVIKRVFISDFTLLNVLDLNGNKSITQLKFVNRLFSL